MTTIPQCGLFDVSRAEMLSSAIQAVREPRTIYRRKTIWLVTALVVVFAAFEIALYLLGACKGYGGLAAFEWSIAAQYLDLWSIDPRTCK